MGANYQTLSGVSPSWNAVQKGILTEEPPIFVGTWDCSPVSGTSTYNLAGPSAKTGLQFALKESKGKNYDIGRSSSVQEGFKGQMFLPKRATGLIENTIYVQMATTCTKVPCISDQADVPPPYHGSLAFVAAARTREAQKAHGICGTLLSMG